MVEILSFPRWTHPNAANLAALFTADYSPWMTCSVSF